MSRQKGVQTKAWPGKKGRFAKKSGQNTLNCAHLPNWFAPFIFIILQISRTLELMEKGAISLFFTFVSISVLNPLSLCSIREICSIRSVLAPLWVGHQVNRPPARRMKAEKEFLYPTCFGFPYNYNRKNVKSILMGGVHQQTCLQPDCSGFYDSKWSKVQFFSAVSCSTSGWPHRKGDEGTLHALLRTIVCTNIDQQNIFISSLNCSYQKTLIVIHPLQLVFLSVIDV